MVALIDGLELRPGVMSISKTQTFLLYINVMYSRVWRRILHLARGLIGLGSSVMYFYFSRIYIF
jgi:hypothetical protein